MRAAWPAERKKYPSRASKLDEFKPVIDESLVANLDAPRKQWRTVRRIFARLIDKHRMVDVSYETVRGYVSKRQPEIRIAAGRGPAEVFIRRRTVVARKPSSSARKSPSSLAVRGSRCSCSLFVLCRAIHRMSTSGGQEAFFEGYVHALLRLGGVPFGKVRYDNLNAAVARVIGLPRRRVETDRWTAFRSHWNLDVFYCQLELPGLTRRAVWKAISALPPQPPCAGASRGLGR
ncbi:hypothetical protein [Nocardia araoensis]|uniref:hypothetical protein n=1 Tax=Nocardia araoensis TaxID=228600 RepID=UPI003570EB81